MLEGSGTAAKLVVESVLAEAVPPPAAKVNVKTWYNAYAGGLPVPVAVKAKEDDPPNVVTAGVAVPTGVVLLLLLVLSPYDTNEKVPDPKRNEPVIEFLMVPVPIGAVRPFSLTRILTVPAVFELTVIDERSIPATFAGKKPEPTPTAVPLAVKPPAL